MPSHSMYAIYAYIGVVLGVNVGIYGIHGVFGMGEGSWALQTLQRFHVGCTNGEPHYEPVVYDAVVGESLVLYTPRKKHGHDPERKTLFLYKHEVLCFHVMFQGECPKASSKFLYGPS